MVAVVHRTFLMEAYEDSEQLPFNVYAETWWLSTDLSEISASDDFVLVTSYEHAQAVVHANAEAGATVETYCGRFDATFTDPAILAKDGGFDIRQGKASFRTIWYTIRADAVVNRVSTGELLEPYLERLKEEKEMYFVGGHLGHGDIEATEATIAVSCYPFGKEVGGLRGYIQKYTYTPERKVQYEKKRAAAAKRRLRELPTVTDLRILLNCLCFFTMTTSSNESPSVVGVQAELTYGGYRPTGREQTFLALRVMMDIQDKLGHPWDGSRYRPACIPRILAKKPMLMAHKDPFWKELVEWLEVAQARQGWEEEPTEAV